MVTLKVVLNVCTVLVKNTKDHWKLWVNIRLDLRETSYEDVN